MGRKKTISNIKKYLKNYRDKHKEVINARARMRAKACALKIENHKKGKTCFKCGYNEHTDILEFHHLKDKIKDISRIRGTYGAKKFEEEIAKCILICPNCHRWLHWKDIKSSKEIFK